MWGSPEASGAQPKALTPFLPQSCTLHVGGPERDDKCSGAEPQRRCLDGEAPQRTCGRGQQCHMLCASFFSAVCVRFAVIGSRAFGPFILEYDRLARSRSQCPPPPLFLTSAEPRGRVGGADAVDAALSRRRLRVRRLSAAPRGHRPGRPMEAVAVTAWAVGRVSDPSSGGGDGNSASHYTTSHRVYGGDAMGVRLWCEWRVIEFSLDRYEERERGGCEIERAAKSL